MKNFWRAIETVHRAVPARWQGVLGEHYEAVKMSFLRATGRKAPVHPCPHECGCWHEIVEHDDGEIVGVCQCDPLTCDNLELTAEAIELFELNTAKLGRSVARAFGCDAKETDMGLPGTWQVGAFSGASLPVVLSIQHNAGDFRNTVAQLVCKLRERFVLLAPTSRYADCISLGMLTGVKAGFFDLESNLNLASNGVLVARRSGGELFSRFLPEPTSDGVAQQLFALVRQLESETSWRKAPILQVFRLYCMENLSRDEVAKRCGCVPSLVTLRLKTIEQKLGRKPSELRQFSSHFEAMEESMSDSRAKRVYRSGMVELPHEDE